MADTGAFPKFMAFLRKGNNLQLAIVAVAAVALIVFICTTIPGAASGQKDDASSQSSAVSKESSETLETKLEKILSQVESAGAVKVLVTYETGPEIVPAQKVDTQTNSSSGSAGQTGGGSSLTQNSEPVVVQGKNGSEPLVLVQKEPVVLGVLVVAEGASDLEVRMRLQEAVQIALQIAPDKIEVLPMNTTSN